MFKTDQLRAVVSERLTAAAEDIFRIFEQTIRDYEETVLRARQKADAQERLEERKALLQKRDGHSKGDPCERSAPAAKEDIQEAPHIKEELEEKLWTGDKQEEADTKDSLFNIIYVQRSDEGGGQLLSQEPGGGKEEHCFENALSIQLKSETSKDSCVVSELTSDPQMSEGSEDEWGDSRKKSWQTGEGADRPYTCNVCGKSFRIKSILTRHMKTHTGEKPYSCSICGKSFIQRSYLQTHMNSHSGQKPHTCSFCGRGFTQVGNMNAHMRIHTGEKPHSCADCGKSFREKADLIKHTIIHTGEKPYICTVCNMRFSAQSNLTRHTKTHSGERPYSCTACGKRFIRRSHLFIHAKTHAAENL